MNKIIKSLIIGLALFAGITAFGQTNVTTTTSTTSTNGNKIVQFFTNVGNDIGSFVKANPDALTQTNWALALGGNYANGKVGASANLSYALNAYMRPGFELDYINGQLYDGSLNTSVGTSYKLFNINSYSYVVAGVGTILSGPNSGGIVNYQGAGTELTLPFDFKLFNKWDTTMAIDGEVDHYNTISGPVVKGLAKFNISF